MWCLVQFLLGMQEVLRRQNEMEKICQRAQGNKVSPDSLLSLNPDSKEIFKTSDIFR